MITKDVCVITEKYKNSMGKDCSKYQNVGVAFCHSDGRVSIKLAKWFNPAGIQEECYLYIFDKKDVNKKSGESADTPNTLANDFPF